MVSYEEWLSKNGYIEDCEEARYEYELYLAECGHINYINVEQISTFIVLGEKTPASTKRSGVSGSGSIRSK